jgi:hypothetical protein
MVFVTEMSSVYNEVRTESLNTIQINLNLQGDCSALTIVTF